VISAAYAAQSPLLSAQLHLVPAAAATVDDVRANLASIPADSLQSLPDNFTLPDLMRRHIDQRRVDFDTTQTLFDSEEFAELERMHAEAANRTTHLPEDYVPENATVITSGSYIPSPPPECLTPAPTPALTQVIDTPVPTPALTEPFTPSIGATQDEGNRIYEVSTGGAVYISYAGSLQVMAYQVVCGRLYSDDCI
jgi:hypothetical protein